MSCFADCGCTCRDWRADDLFDDVVATETTIDVTVRGVIENHRGWYFDGPQGRGIRDVRGLDLRDVSGIYILWRQADHCPDHGLEHLRAWYVGKSGSNMEARVESHQLRKQINEELATEVSVWEGPNRQAKYLEQLLLDCYSFPGNGNEMRGTQPLCHHIGPAAWN